MRTRRVAVAAVLILCGAAAVAGCGPDRQRGDAAPAGGAVRSSASEVTTAPGNVVPSGADAGSRTNSAGAGLPGPCRANQLRGDIEQFEAPGQAGSQNDAWLSLFNTGPRCTLSGFVRLQLLTASGQPRETRVTRTNDKPTTVTLGTGDTAWTLLEWRTTPNADEAATEPLCGPKADAVQVTLPGREDSLRIVENIRIICQHGEIIARPLSATKPSLGR